MRPQSHTQPDRGKAPLRVLIADDSPDARLMAQTFLSLLGFEVCTATDGRDALNLAARFRPDIVFLDLWMPEMDGVEACARLREGPCPKPIPIFAITADPGRLESLHDDCFDHVLTKPVELERIAELVLQRESALGKPTHH